jgi:soluble lytic murein transglycosylase
MKKSRLSFARYSPSRRKQRKKLFVVAAGAALCTLMVGASLLTTKYSSQPKQGGAWLNLQEQTSTKVSNQASAKVSSEASTKESARVNTSVLRLVLTPPKERAAQLEALATQEEETTFGFRRKSLNRARARYVLAADLIDQKQGEKALGWLEGLEQDYPVLAAHIALKRAQAYEIMGDKDKAQEAWQDLIKEHSDEPVVAEALYALSSDDPKYWEKAIAKFPPRPRPLEIARQWYAFSPEDPQYLEQAIKKFPSHPHLLEIARQRLRQNPNQPELMLLLAKYAFDTPGVTSVLDQLVSKYGEAEGDNDEPLIQPEDWEAIAVGYWRDRKYGQASAAYAKAPRTSRNAYLAALGLQYAEKPADAKRAYKQMVRDFPNAKETPSALLQIAELEPNVEMVPYLDQVIEQFPDRAGEALLVKAETLDGLKSSQAAAEARELLVTKYGQSDAAAEYRWKVARAKATAGDIEAALQWAEPILTQNPDSLLARQAGFWVGKWANKLGRKQQAIAAFEQVVAQHPQSYYAWRSAVRLGWKVGDFTTVRKLSPKVVLPAERPMLPIGSAALKELYQLGQDRDAWMLWQAEFQNRLEPTVTEQFTDGIMRLAIGDHLEGISRIATLEDRETPDEQAEYQALRQQLTYWHALYPFPFLEAIETYAQQRRLNPLLVTAVIRQESRFEPKIRSTAGAVGLMQLLPDTGAWAAKQMKLQKYTLDNPEHNIKLGTWFLDQVHQSYNNNSLLAVASYNAGSGNMAKWSPTKGSTDPDEFVEAIPFDETRDYVKQVFGNYWNYLRLYDPQVQEQLAKHSANQSTAMRQ